MSGEKETTTKLTTDTKEVSKTEVKTNVVNRNSTGARGGNPNARRGRGGRNRKNDKKHNKEDKDGLDKRIVTIRRVSHTYKGGKRMSLSVLVVVGDRKGKVGAAIGKGADVKTAETKAYNKAKKNMVTIKLHNTTIAHEIFHKKGAVKIFMKPAAPGTGVIAGASLRAVLELVGVKDILTKIIGATNPITNVYATIEALESLKD